MAASSSSTATATAPAPVRSSFHDVFLSFRGTDTRNNFTSHLLAALDQRGFATFQDDAKLKRGEDISSELIKAIEESRVSIVVFSKNYAGSKWCLDELVKIMECRRDFGQIVLPIFYDVPPSDVRGQRGCFSEAFEKHESRRLQGTLSMSKMEGWKAALTDAADLSGWELQHVANQNEAKLIELVVKDITNRLDRQYLNVADQPVGIDSRVQKLKTILNLESDDVRIVGIWGAGGIGKTTIAKAIFNCIRDKFKGSSFLANVSDISKEPSGMVKLQKQLLANVLRTNGTHDLDNHHEGVEEIKRKLPHRKVLIVLDDADHVEQLEMLAIKRHLFWPGSRIIVTTRNRSILDTLRVDSIYSPAQLDGEESLKLLSLKAFNTNYPVDGYEQLTKEVVAYAGGLPLALEVLGSFLTGKSADEWQISLQKLKLIPDGDIQRKLQVSFESLDDKNKELFLDIVFFFIWRDKDFIVKVLKESDNFPEIGILELARRCLVKIERNNEVWMHNLLRDMGREIVRQESMKEPGERSRLWYEEDVLRVLKDRTGTKAIEGLSLHLAVNNDKNVDTKAFANMSNLRLLRLNHLQHLRGMYTTSSRRLQWISWHGFPLSHIPDELFMGNLVAIDLQHSRLKKLWKGLKILNKLRFLNLSYSQHLTKTPDFSGLRSLEQLLLRDCTKLVEVHSSIGCLDKLLTLNMANCKNLEKVPSGLFKLSALEYLDLSGCSKLDEQVGSKGPISMFRQALTKRQDYNIIAISSASLSGLSCLRTLNLEDCNLRNVPSDIVCLMSLENLFLDGNNFCSLPSGFGNLSRLRNVSLNRCARLESLPDFTSNITLLSVNYCLSLGTKPVILQLQKGSTMELRNCPQVDWNHICNNFKRTILPPNQGRGSDAYQKTRTFFSADEVSTEFLWQTAHMSYEVRSIASKKGSVVRTFGKDIRQSGLIRPDRPFRKFKRMEGAPSASLVKMISQAALLAPSFRMDIGRR